MTHIIHVHCRYICICPLCLDISDLSVEPYPQPKPLPNSTDFAAFLKGDLEYEFVRLMQILDRRRQAHQHISQTHKLLSENTFIITFEMPGFVGARSFTIRWVLS